MPRVRTNPALADTTNLFARIPLYDSLGTNVDDSFADTPRFPAAPTTFFGAGTQSGSPERWAVWRFPSVLSSVRLLSFLTRDFSTLLEGATGSPGYSFQMELISTAFDITSITWNNKPAGALFGAPFDFFWGGPTAAESHSKLINRTSMGIHATADVVGTFYGCYFRPVSISLSGSDGMRISSSVMSDLVVIRTR